MYPILLQLGPFKIYSYGFMIAIGFLLCIHFVTRDAERQGIHRNVVHEVGFWALFWGVFGSRLMHIILYPQYYSWQDPIGWIALWRGGLVFQGALPAVLVYAVWSLRRRGVSFWRAVDIAFPYIPLGHAFGRIGCVLNGCCFGVRADNFPLALAFPRQPFDTSLPASGSPAYLAHLERFGELPGNGLWSYPVHPTQLYESAALFGLFAMLWLLRRHWHPFIGFTMPVYLVTYSLFRFCLEFIRGDGNPQELVAGLSDQQVFALAAIGVGALLFVVLYRFAPRYPEDPQNPVPAAPARPASAG